MKKWALDISCLLSYIQIAHGYSKRVLTKYQWSLRQALGFISLSLPEKHVQDECDSLLCQIWII